MISRKWILSAAMLAFTALPAFADTQTEEYVRSNANDVLASLNAPGLTAAERRVQFQSYMDEFANLDAVAKFVIGKYAKRFSDEEMEAYLATFRAYALAVYEFYFNEYRGRDVKVVGSTDRNARDSIVDTEIVRADGQELEVRWRVLNRGGKYQVVDVALNAEGNLIWLAIEQQAQFLSILDQNNGSSDALIAKINSMTDELVALRPADES
ncbi:MAG: ABC transporter substrate-binding protein [Cognatishimia sp.]|nr:ABC transporter substrate-binding protein [Cognatishimia sp.]NQY40432.1 ABC transporter substrate-binding protein [Henriciella sp.]